MITFPNAKINIGLNIVAKRPDGYHDIETLFFPVNLQDALEVTLKKPLDTGFIKKKLEAGSLLNLKTESKFQNDEVFTEDSYELHLLGDTIEGNPADNLVVKAYRLLAEDFDIPPVIIHLYKHIPSGAGLGGGSSDAAQMIALLNKRFGLKMKSRCMERYAAQLGSDCAFFIRNKPAFATGRGEILTPVDMSLQGYSIVIVKPNIFVSTAQAYAGVTPAKPQVSLRDAIKRPVSEWKDLIVNDFEKSVFANYPQLQQLKDKMYELGAEYASMSGSGSAIYGIFSKPVANVEEHFPGIFCRQRDLI